MVVQIWISPVVDNVVGSSGDGEAYHGYWARVSPRFSSLASSTFKIQRNVDHSILLGYLCCQYQLRICQRSGSSISGVACQRYVSNG